MLRGFITAVVILPLAFGPAQSQTLRSVVVPADAALAVPPRGQSLPAPARLPPAPVAAPAGASVVAPAPLAAAPLAAAPMGLAAASGLLLPLAAGVLFGGALAGGGSGTGAPAATR